MMGETTNKLSGIFRYGKHESQFIRLSRPAKPLTRLFASESEDVYKVPVAVLLHGGFWKQKWNIDNTPIASIVSDLSARGFAVVEVEYRRREDPGGGWPGSNEDVLTALESLESIAQSEWLPMDLNSIVIIGHSAGGTLALWTAANAQNIVPALVVAVAPITDLVKGYTERLSDEGDAIELYMKCPPDSTDSLSEYSKASPSALLPLNVATLLVTGSEDADVPSSMVLEYYAAAMMARDKSESVVGGAPELRLLELSGSDHYQPLTYGSSEWTRIVDTMMAMLNRKHQFT